MPFFQFNPEFKALVSTCVQDSVDEVADELRDML